MLVLGFLVRSVCVLWVGDKSGGTLNEVSQLASFVAAAPFLQLCIW